MHRLRLNLLPGKATNIGLRFKSKQAEQPNDCCSHSTSTIKISVNLFPTTSQEITHHVQHKETHPSFAIAVVLVACATSAKADVTGTATNITLDMDFGHYSGEFHLVNGDGEKWVKVHTDNSLDPLYQLNYENRISSNQTVDWLIGYGMVGSGEYTMYSSAHWRYLDSNGWRLIDEDTDTGVDWQ